MESKWKTAWRHLRIGAIGMLLLWVVLFIVRNWSTSAPVDWVVGKTDTNVAMVIFVSLIVGVVVGGLLLHLALRRGRR